jgi:uncharacterized protein YjiS (DUF1127 family)
MINTTFSGRRHNRHAHHNVGLAAGVTAHFSIRLMAWRQRHHLARLDDARLEDLGITRAAALAEANRSFWDIPQGWLR